MLEVPAETSKDFGVGVPSNFLVFFGVPPKFVKKMGVYHSAGPECRTGGLSSANTLFKFLVGTPKGTVKLRTRPEGGGVGVGI